MEKSDKERLRTIEEDIVRLADNQDEMLKELKELKEPLQAWKNGKGFIATWGLIIKLAAWVAVTWAFILGIITTLKDKIN